MRQRIRRWLSICLCAVMLVTALPFTAYAGFMDSVAGFFSLLEDSSAFQTLEIRAGSLNGAKVVDLLNPSGSWEIQAGVDYYLYGEVKKTEGSDYVQIRFGNEDETYNGVTFFNPPGGTYTAGNISHDYFDQLVSYTGIGDPTYGSSNSKIVLQDGTMLYHIKTDVAVNSTVNFAMGLIVQDAAFSGTQILTDAIQVAAGTYDSNSTTFTPVSTKTSNLSMADKAAVKGYYNGTSLAATLDETAGTISFYISEADKNRPAELLYEKLEYDIICPVNAELDDVGFTTAFAKTSTTYGTLSVGKTVVSGDTKTIHITVTDGYRRKNATMNLYYRLKFSSAAYQDGQTAKTTVSNIVATMKDQTTAAITAPSTQVTYSILDASKDSTTLAAVNRTEVYNSTIAGTTAYNANLGGVLIVNKNVSQPTPREKTYEASFNTTNTAARISIITVPLGTSDSPSVIITGKNAAGEAVTIQVENPVNYAYSGFTKKSTIADAASLRFQVSDFAAQGLVTFTGVRAEIGRLRANYKTSGWTSSWAYDANNASAYGYFTTTETGIQVKNTYRLYNTDPNYRDAAAGDLTVTSTATSATRPRVGFNSGTTTIKNSSGTTVDSIAAGDSVIIKGSVFPYSVPGAEKGASGTGTTSYLADPVFYLTLPQGMSYEELDFSYGGQKSGALSASVDNISYLNTTGDGVSLYRISFPEGTEFGYFTEEGKYQYVNYSITLRTSKSLETKRYELNSLIGISAKNQVEALPYSSNPSTLNTIVADTYGINGGNNYAGVTKGSAADQPGFGLQQMAEVNVYNAVAVTNINGIPVAGEWNAYDASNPNSVATLGANSSGKFRIKIENTSDTAASNLQIMIPVPKAGIDLGDTYMTQASQFDMKMTFEENAVSTAGFTASYVTITATDELNSAFVYTSSDSETANAILLSRDSLPGKNDEATGGIYEFTFDFTVDGGAAGNQNIWRDAFLYTTSDGVTQYKTGSYVASEVAGGTISGTVYHDADRDGVKDAEEAGVAGVTVVAKDADNRILSTTTDSYGYYEFLAVREAESALTFTIAESESLRFNIETDTTMVTPSSDGLSAAATVTAAASTTVNAGLSGYYTLTYHKNSGVGNVPENQEYVEGAQAAVAVKPDNLLRTGYVFKEWNTLADGKGTGFQPGELFTINADTTLYAVWELGTYTVHFNYRGATGGNSITEKQLVHNQTYNTGGALPAPTKDGYTFVGWCTTSSGTTGNAKDTTRFITGADTTLYAVWSAKTGYTVNYETGDGGSAVAPVSVSWEDKVAPSGEPTRMGYRFTGWKEKSAGTAVTDQTTFGQLADSEAAGTEITLTALWMAKSNYTVSYDVNGGNESYTAKSVSWDESGLLPETNPTQDGYAFAGWKLGSTEQVVGSTDTYGSLAASESGTGITLTASWELLQEGTNTVHYNTGGGTVYVDKTNVNAADTGLIPETDPVKAGYTFAGWMYQGTSVTANTVYSTISPASSITLTADWITKNYTISYNVSGFDTVTKNWTDSGLLPGTDPVRDGGTFAGWYYGNTEVTAATTVAQLIPADQTTNLTLTARWSEQTFTIVYDSAGGTGYSPKTAVSYSQTGLLPDSTPVKTGYTFAGWYQGETQVTTQTVCGSLAAVGQVVTLISRWTPKTGYSIVYNSAGGTSVETKTEIGWDDSNLIPETAPVRIGYTFGGWVYGRNSVVTGTTYGSLAASDTASSITLVAQWTTGSYTVIYDTGGGTAISSKSVGWGSSNLLPSVTPRSAGMTFTGWKCGEVSVTAATLYSELAVTEKTSEITLTAQYTPVSDDHDGMGTDVQGRIVESDESPVYKIDLSWGPMTYQFSVQKGWDPEKHTYSTGTQGHWNAESFDGSNNCVTAANHSNADVELDFIVTKTVMADGGGSTEGTEDTESTAAVDPFGSVTMLMNRTNGDAGESATGMFLGKVPAESAEAPEISAYLRIIGEPDNISIMNMNTYEKVGVITVTVEAAGGSITPRNKE